MLDLHPRPRRLHHESADFLRARVHGHHHQEPGQGAVGAPQLRAVQHVGGPVRGFLGGGGDARGVGAHLRLGQGKGGDLTGGASGQVLLLLLLGAEMLERVGHPDRLVGGQQGHEVPVAAAQQLHHLLVLDVGEAEAAILFRDLHPKGAHAAQLGENIFGVLPRGVDLDRIHLVAQELAHPLVEPGKFRAVLGGQGVGVDEVQAEAAQEKLAQEARLRPFGLARGFGNLARIVLADGGGTAHYRAILPHAA